MNLAIVPARGGSKRLKDKNIAPLGALPLIYYSLTAIIDSQCFDKVVVTTDCQKIKKAIQIFNKNAKFKVCIHDRPSKFATDESSALEAVLEYLDQRLENPSKVGYFLPTCPLISFQDIQQGMARLTDAYDFCISVTNMGDPIQLAMSMSTKTGGLYPVTDNLSLGKVNSRFITQHYKPSGGFYLGWDNSIRTYRNFFKGDIRGTYIPKERSIDIDDIHDIKIAEYYMDLPLEAHEV